MIPKTRSICLLSALVLLSSCYSYNIKRYTTCRSCILQETIPLRKNGVYICYNGYDSTEKKNRYMSFVLYNDCTVKGGPNSSILAKPAELDKKLNDHVMTTYQTGKWTGANDRNNWGCYSINGDKITLQRSTATGTGSPFAGEWDAYEETGTILNDSTILISRGGFKRWDFRERNDLYVLREWPSKPDSANWLRNKINRRR